MALYLRFLFRFLVILIIQVFIINKLYLTTVLNPNIMVYLVLGLPFNQKPVYLLSVSFASGLLFDVFLNSPGYCSTAALVVAYARYFYLKNFSRTEILETNLTPNTQQMGFLGFLVYAAIHTLIFHLVLATLQSFSVQLMFANLLEALVSALGTLSIIMLAELLTVKKIQMV